MNARKYLPLMFDRPLEPLFTPKGPNHAIFRIPQSYLPDRYKPLGMQLTEQFEDEVEETVHIKEIKLPDLGDVLHLDRNGHFSLFVPWHQQLAADLIQTFMGMKNIDEVMSLAAYARDRINPHLFIYALSVTILHRKDAKGIGVPALIYSFPNNFIDSSVFTKAREEAFIVPENIRIPLVIPMEFSASKLDLEHRMAYFREDIGINLHHWHWHLIYPLSGPSVVVNKNRRGELFYYMHQQILARYNTDRMCNKLSRVERLVEWREPIKEGYFSKLNNLAASRNYPGRVDYQRMTNLARGEEQIFVDIDDLTQWRDRIVEAIHSGYYIDRRGERVPLTEFEGIDVLGNIIEASSLSPNPSYYGNLHNFGHILLAFIHDPDQRFLESFGVMAGTSTAMRDPVFYRWHSYIDFLFQIHKSVLPRYTMSQLNYDGVRVTNVRVLSQKATDNHLHTFWQQSEIDLSYGLDFIERGPLLVRFTHLQHYPFTYTITVDNNGLQRMGTCRIFIAPEYNEKGLPMQFREHKNLFIALDRFTVTLKPGVNTITRSSKESTVTIPFEQTFRNLGDSTSELNYCGCGWPHHMLLPKGIPNGYPCQLFVMISNYADDAVVPTIPGSCKTADNYCGVRDGLYPDRRSMGYPFDRMPRPGVQTLEEFLTPNMKVERVNIYFHDRIFKPVKPQS
ncbi:hypothetical protein RN001_010539 [Aquatica leii]|uniref:Tyrosinase copper-binding domain-containing protein n=1 Tax=Aquatica leii TaxID=1421715 RepID=A0AAN7P808_9COLE|nr:hypothetical protein RN001_010539 [Aquatica leii]